MNKSEIPQQRLHNQHIAVQRFKEPSDIVAHLGAVQAQDYAAAKWALGLRLQGATDDFIEQALTDGSILRTHLMRPTWHFVTPADIRWLLALTAPRVHALSAYYYRKEGLDLALFTRCNDVMIKALQGGRQLTRDELRKELAQAGIAADSTLRMSYIMMQAEMDGIICSGGRRGKQFTYALLEERVPQVKAVDRDEALAKLARGFFSSHGPATIQDFAKWSGLTVTDSKNGLEAIKSQLEHEQIEGKDYWFPAPVPPPTNALPVAYLLPNYDEYTIGYHEHSAIFDSANFERLIFSHTIVINGRVAGTWKRALTKNSVIIETSSFTRLTEAEDKAVTVAAQQFATFLKLDMIRKMD